VMNGLYYNEINFGMGLLLGVFGFSAAVVGASAISTARSWAASCSPACRRSAPSPCLRQRLQGRVCARRHHRDHDVAADRPDRRKIERAGVSMPAPDASPSRLPAIGCAAVATVYGILFLAAEASSRSPPCSPARPRRSCSPGAWA